MHSTGILGIPRTVLRAASTAVAECSCTGMTRATGSPQLDNTISKPYCLFFPELNPNFKVDLGFYYCLGQYLLITRFINRRNSKHRS